MKAYYIALALLISVNALAKNLIVTHPNGVKKTIQLGTEKIYTDEIPETLGLINGETVTVGYNTPEISGIQLYSGIVGIPRTQNGYGPKFNVPYTQEGTLTARFRVTPGEANCSVSSDNAQIRFTPITGSGSKQFGINGFRVLAGLTFNINVTCNVRPGSDLNASVGVKVSPIALFAQGFLGGSPTADRDVILVDNKSVVRVDWNAVNIPGSQCSLYRRTTEDFTESLVATGGTQGYYSEVFVHNNPGYTDYHYFRMTCTTPDRKLHTSYELTVGSRPPR